MIGVSKNIWDFDPRSIPGCALWLDGNDPAATGVQPANSSTVSTWVDKSGNANNGISGSATFIKDSLGGYINFTGSQYYDITNPNIVVNQYFTVFIVEQIGDVPLSSAYGLMGGTSTADNGNLHIVYRTANTIAFAFWNNDLAPSMSAYGYGTGTTQPTRLWSFSFTASSRIIFLNGTSIGSDANNTFLSSATGTAIGRVLTQSYYTGKMREVMIYSGTIDTTQRKQIEGYLARKWNLTLENLFFPTSVSNCVLWLDADDSTKFTGGANWLDKSGTNNHGINGTANVSAMPTVTTWSNGRRAARFVSASKNSMKSTNAISNFTSYFMVARIQAAVGYGFFMINNYDGQRQMPMNTTSFPATVYFYTGGNIMTIGSFAQSEGFIFCGTVTSGSSFTYGNGVQTGTNASVSTSASSDHYFGSGNGDGGYLSIDIAEIIVYTGVVSSTDRQSIENYLSVKWNIPLSRSGVTINPFNYIRPFSRRFNPIDISGCAMWFDATDPSTITLSSGSLTQWNDKSGNGRNLTAVSGYANATVSSAFQNGLNVFNFSGNGLYRAAANSAVYPLDAYIIVALKSLTAQSDVLSIGPTDADNFNSLIFSEGTQSRWKNGSSYGVRNVFSTSDETSTGFLLIQWSIANNNYLLRRNGILLGQSSSFTYTLPAGSIFQVGFRHQNITSANFSGYIGEIVVFNSQLSNSQRQQMEGYLANKWGLNPIYGENTPLMVPGCRLWLDAADSNTVLFSSGSNVSRWNDKSGQGNNSFALSTPRPDVTYNSNKIIFSSGNQNGLSNTTLILPETSYTIFSVFSNTSSPNAGFNYPIFTGYGGSAAFGVFNTAGNIYVGPNQATLTTLSPTVSALGSTSLLSLTSSGSYGTIVTFPNTGTNLQQNTATNLTGSSTASSALTGISCVMIGAYLVTSGNPGILGSLLTPNASGGIWYAAVYDTAYIKMVRLSYTQGTPNTITATAARYAVFSAVPTNSTIQGLWDNGTSTDYANTPSANGYGVQSLLWSVSGASATVTPYVNGLAKTTISAATFPSTGYLLSPGVAGAGFIGTISEIILYNSVLSEAQRQMIESYLARKWGLTISNQFLLTHPFYRTPPSSILPFLPRGISGCQLWLDGADPAGTGIQPANGSSVLTWVDKSGNGRNATVVTTPLVKSAATYSTEFSALNFSDSNRAYVTTYPANPVNETVFVVFNNPSPDSRNYSLINGQAGARALGTAWANATNAGTRVAYLNNDVAWSTAVTPELSYTAGTTRILTGQVSNSTNHSIALNGANFSTGSTASGFSANTFTYLGWNANSGSFTGAGNPTMYYYIGYAMEIIFYDSVLTTAQRQQVEGYLSEKWGLRSFLPSTHLYKSFAPSFLPYAITSSGSGGAYSNFLWTRFYNITSSGPSIDGPGSSGWGSLIGTAGAYNPINYQDGDSRIGQSDQVGVISKGFMYSASATVVTFRTVSDDGIVVIFNGTNVINNWTLHGDTTDTSASVTLPAGYTPIELRFFEWGGGFTCELYWSVGSTGTYVSDGTSRMYHNNTSK
jgi:hypothetical protein